MIQNQIEGVTGNDMTRLWGHEVNAVFEDVAINQTILVKRGPFRSEKFKVLGKLKNRFDTFYFCDPQGD